MVMMDIPPCGHLFRPARQRRIHVNRPPLGLRTTREAAKRQTLRLEMLHHHMPAHAAQGLTRPANRQPNEHNRADEDGVAAEGPLELAVVYGQTHNVSHSNELASSPTIRSVRNR